MDAIADTIKTYFIPGSLSFLILTTTVSAGLLLVPHDGYRRAGRWLLFVVVAAYWLFCIPAIAAALENGYPLVTTRAAEQCIQSGSCTVVVLGSGVETFGSGGRATTRMSAQSALNALRGIQLAHRTAGAVIVSGGVAEVGGSTSEADVLVSALRQHGIARERIVVEERSRSTREQAQEVAHLARANGFERLVVVTNPAHLRRALATLRAQGIDAAGYPAQFISDTSGSLSRWSPSVGACRTSRDALYEYLAYGYYWSRGWL